MKSKRYDQFAKKAGEIRYNFAWQQVVEDDPMDIAMESVVDRWRWWEVYVLAVG